MSLNKQNLISQLTDLFNHARKFDGTHYTAEEKAIQLANIIDTYIKTATVNVVNITGTCVTPQGPGTISGTGTGNLT